MNIATMSCGLCNKCNIFKTTGLQSHRFSCHLDLFWTLSVDVLAQDMNTEISAAVWINRL